MKTYKGYIWIAVCFYILLMLKLKDDIVLLDIITVAIFGIIIFIDSKYLID